MTSQEDPITEFADEEVKSITTRKLVLVPVKTQKEYDFPVEDMVKTNKRTYHKKRKAKRNEAEEEEQQQPEFKDDDEANEHFERHFDDEMGKPITDEHPSAMFEKREQKEKPVIIVPESPEHSDRCFIPPPPSTKLQLPVTLKDERQYFTSCFNKVKRIATSAQFAAAMTLKPKTRENDAINQAFAPSFMIPCIIKELEVIKVAMDNVNILYQAQMEEMKALHFARIEKSDCRCREEHEVCHSSLCDPEDRILKAREAQLKAIGVLNNTLKPSYH